LPIPTFDPSRPDQSVLEAGSLSCDNIGTTATGSVTATISGADLSFEHIPTLTLGGTTIASRVPDFKAASYGVIRVFVPLADIDAAGGSLATVNRYRNLDLRSITNQSNFNGSGEDQSNNTHALTLTNRGGAFTDVTTLTCRPHHFALDFGQGHRPTPLFWGLVMAWWNPRKASLPIHFIETAPSSQIAMQMSALFLMTAFMKSKNIMRLMYGLCHRIWHGLCRLQLSGCRDSSGAGCSR